MKNGVEPQWRRESQSEDGDERYGYRNKHYISTVQNFSNENGGNKGRWATLIQEAQHFLSKSNLS